MLYLIGLGLGGAKSISLEGLEVIKKCDKVYLETYTSLLPAQLEELEELYGCKINEADREFVESGSEEILIESKIKNVAFLVIGDVMSATTHADFILRARKEGIKNKIIHGVSILSAVNSCGLQEYLFGRIVSIPYWNDNWEPDSFYDHIAENRKRGLHTRCLLDIKVKEPTLESLTKKKKEYMEPRFMSVAEASNQLIKILEKRKLAGQDLAFTDEDLIVGLARVGSENEKIIICSLKEMCSIDLGDPLHCLMIPAAQLHPMEVEFLSEFANNQEEFLQKVKTY